MGTLGKAGLYVITKEVRFEWLWFQSFLTWDGTYPVNFLFQKVAAVSPKFRKVYKFIATSIEEIVS